MKPITKMIDLHCDTISECESRNVNLTSETLNLSLAKRPENLRICQAMAIFMPDKYRGREAEAYFGSVYQQFIRQMRILQGEMTNIRILSDIDKELDRNPFVAFLTVEGGSALAGKIESVKKIYDLGVRMMTLTWNAANEICGGSETDSGFTAFGKKAVSEMEKLGMIVDVSHISDRGFFELCEFAQRPFVASHSNSRAVCDHKRNLTDEMFTAIKSRGGLVGLNYYNNFIVKEGKSRSIDDLLRHVHHFLALGGEDTLALGSDFDGAEMPEYLNSVEKTEVLFEAMEKSGIPLNIIEKIRYSNARNFFEMYEG